MAIWIATARPSSLFYLLRTNDMKNKILLYAACLLSTIILNALSCRKNVEEQLPPETHEGNYTIGFKVDGKVYTASGKGGLLASEHVIYSFSTSDSSINIFAGDTKSKFSIELIIKYLGNPGIYLMKTYPYQGTFYDDSNGTIPGTSNTFTTTDNYTGKVTVKYFNGSYAPYNKGTILSGTFEMDAVNGNGKVIHITEGRFDIGQ